MGDSRALPGFGELELDLDLEDDGGETPAHGMPAAALPSFPFEGEPVPPSTSRVFPPANGRNESARHTRRTLNVNEESTRIVSGDALAAITRPPPPPASAADDGHTRAWAEADDRLLANQAGATEEDLPPSGSGVAARDGRVAAMRELYAKGDAAGALELAAHIGDSLAPDGDGDHPDASPVVEVGAEESLDLSDPFGALLSADAPRPVPCAAPQLSLTERHSIPSILKSPQEVSKLPIDHRAGFLLAHVDGMQTLEEILDVCAMPATEALDLIAKLKQMGVIEFE
jgi:hypothetical protein